MREYWNMHKRRLLVTCAVILLPIVGGVLLWDKLPDQVPVHWGVNGEVDGWASKPFAVFTLPLIMAGLQLVCFFASAWDPKTKNISKKMLGLVLWIIPVLNLILNVVAYLAAFQRNVNMPVILCLMMGALWVVMGNYLPKCKQSYTMGIKLPWTLNDEQNWNATHRMAGKLWVAGGLLTMGCALLPPTVAFIALTVILLTMVGIPTVYAYRYYITHKNDE